MAVGMAELADRAIQDHYERPCAPRVLIEKTGDGWKFANPWDDEHRERWEALLFQTFGTRSSAIMNHFLDVFTKLVGDGEWDEDRHAWMPKQNDFDAVVAIVHSLKPENEAQAAYAAQLCALHLSAMNLGKQATRTYADSRTVAVLNKTVRAYGDGMERLARLQGKVQPRTVHQTIQVVYYDNRDQRSVQLTGGAAPFGGRPQGTDGGAAIRSPALPSPNQGGAALPSPSGEGQESVPVAWWRLWIGRTFRRAER